MERKGTSKLLIALFAAVFALGIAPTAAFAAPAGANLQGGVVAQEEGVDDSSEDSENVQSIQFTPAQELTLIEGVDGVTQAGYWDYEAGEWVDQEWFEYSFPGFSQGDELVVSFSDGSPDKTYVFDEDRWEFVNEEDGDAINNLGYVSDQSSDNVWGLGEHAFTFEYMGKTCEVKVDIVANPVSGIRLNSAEAPKLVEDVDGEIMSGYLDENGDWVEQEWFEYSFPGFSQGDELVVSFSDGSPDKTYVFDEDSLSFVNEDDGDSINLDSYSDQSGANEWAPGLHTFTVRYMGQTCNLEVEVVANQVSGIELNTAETPQLVEGVDGDTEYEDDQLDQQWFEYSFPGFAQGDELVVSLNDGSSKTYVYDGGRHEFVNADDEEDTIDPDDFKTHSDQAYDKTWGVGEHAFTVEYMNQACELKVNVVANPVSGIKLNLVETPELTYEVDGYWDNEDGVAELNYFEYSFPGFSQGDKLVVSLNDGSTKTYVFDEARWEFVNENNDEDVISDGDLSAYSGIGHESGWEVGEQAFTVEYMGQSCEYKVNVVENDVQSISVELAEPLVLYEGVDGWLVDWDDETDPWFRFEEPSLCKEGNKLIVTKTDGASITYTLNEYDEFVDPDGNEAVLDCSFAEEQSGEAPWQAGDNPQLVVKYNGRECMLDVEIKANPVQSIEFTPKNKLTIIDAEANIHKCPDWGADEDDDWDESYYDWDNEDYGIKTWNFYAAEPASYYRDEDDKLVGPVYDPERPFGLHGGDALVVTDTSGNRTSFTFDGGVFQADASTIDPYDVYRGVSYESNQSQDNPWALGKADMVMTLTYFGKSCSAPVTIVASDSDEAVEAAKAMIENLPAEVETDAEMAQVNAAKAAYDALSEERQASVGDEAKSKLAAAVKSAEEYAESQPQQSDGDKAVEDVKAKIGSLPTKVETDEQKAQVDAAKAAYDKLTPAQKELVGDVVSKLNAAIKSAEDYAKSKKDAASKPTVKKANPMAAKAKTVKAKAKKLKKKAQKIAVAKAITVSNAQGNVTYKLKSIKAKKKLQKQAKKKIKMASNGQITLKKKLKKGAYTLTVDVTAAGNANYNAVTKTVKVKVKVK